MGRRKRLLREKRKAKHHKAAMAGLKYRVALAVKEHFRMKNIADTYLQRPTKASLKREPMPMAVITYQAFRDSDTARAAKDFNKEAYDAEAWDSIVRMAVILKKFEWEEYQIEEFITLSRELAGLE